MSRSVLECTGIDFRMPKVDIKFPKFSTFLTCLMTFFGCSAVFLVPDFLAPPVLQLSGWCIGGARFFLVLDFLAPPVLQHSLCGSGAAFRSPCGDFRAACEESSSCWWLSFKNPCSIAIRVKSSRIRVTRRRRLYGSLAR